MEKLVAGEAISTFAGSFMLPSNPDADKSAGNFQTILKGKHKGTAGLNQINGTMFGGSHHFKYNKNIGD
jgi:hypothetical protein